MKRFIAAASIAAGMWLGLSAPAGAIIIIGGAEATLGGPDTRLGVEVGMQPCISGRTAFPCIAEGGLQPCISESLMAPCIAEGGLQPCVSESLFDPCIADVTVGVRIDSSGRS